MRERTGPVLRAGCAGLLLLAEGPCLSWLSLAFLARLPGLDLKPLPLTFDRRCYRTGLVARRSAEDLAPVRRFEQIVRDIALERPDGSNLPALAGRAPSRSAVRRLGDDRALVVGRSGNGHALSGESGDRDTLISSAGTIDGSPALGRTRSPAALDPEEERRQMKKSEFASHVASRTSLTRAAAEAAVNAVLTTITDTLAKGDTVTIAGFGTFSTRTRPAPVEAATRGPASASPSGPRRRRRSRRGRPCATRSASGSREPPAAWEASRWHCRWSPGGGCTMWPPFPQTPTSVRPV